MVRDLIAPTQDKDGNLVHGFTLTRKAYMSEACLENYPCDGSVPPELLDICLTHAIRTIPGEEPRRQYQRPTRRGGYERR